MIFPLTDEDEQNAHDDLQAQWDAQQGDERHVEGELWPLLQHGLQLGGVGHQEGHVQHALGRALLVGVVVHVDGPTAGPEPVVP